MPQGAAFFRFKHLLTVIEDISNMWGRSSPSELEHCTRWQHGHAISRDSSLVLFGCFGALQLVEGRVHCVAPHVVEVDATHHSNGPNQWDLHAEHGFRAHGSAHPEGITDEGQHCEKQRPSQQIQDHSQPSNALSPCVRRTTCKSMQRINCDKPQILGSTESSLAT